MKKNISVYEIDDHEKIRLPLTSDEWLEVTLALFNQQSKVKVDEVDSVQANQDPTGEEKLALESVIVAADHGVNIDAIDFNGSTALHDAALRNLSTIVMELAIRGASINVLNDSGQTPLDLAILGERRLASNILASETPESSGPSARAVLEGLGALKSEEL